MSSGWSSKRWLASSPLPAAFGSSRPVRPPRGPSSTVWRFRPPVVPDSEDSIECASWREYDSADGSGRGHGPRRTRLPTPSIVWDKRPRDRTATSVTSSFSSVGNLRSVSRPVTTVAQRRRLRSRRVAQSEARGAPTSPLLSQNTRPRTRAATSPMCRSASCRSAAGDEGHDDVGGIGSRSSDVDGRRWLWCGVYVASRELDIAERYAGVECGHDEGGAQHVGVDDAEPRSFADRSDPAVSGASIEALVVLSAKDRAFIAGLLPLPRMRSVR